MLYESSPNNNILNILMNKFFILVLVALVITDGPLHVSNLNGRIFPYEDTQKSIYQALNEKYKSKPPLISKNEYYSTDSKDILKSNIQNVVGKGVTGMI